MNPCGQLQVKEFTPSTHTPSFTQGLAAQSSLSEIEKDNRSHSNGNIIWTIEQSLKSPTVINIITILKPQT